MTGQESLQRVNLNIIDGSNGSLLDCLKRALFTKKRLSLTGTLLTKQFLLTNKWRRAEVGAQARLLKKKRYRNGI